MESIKYLVILEDFGRISIQKSHQSILPKRQENEVFLTNAPLAAQLKLMFIALIHFEGFCNFEHDNDEAE